MMKRFFVAALLSFVVTLFVQLPTGALSLKLQPLEVRSTLKAGEVQKGYLDISNPMDSAVTISTSVQGFRQINGGGELEFYNDTKLTDGIVPDMATIQLGPREAFRMYYTVKSSALPEGDIFAAIFFTVKSPEGSVQSAVRVGTLLELVNGQVGSRKAEITGLTVPFFQMNGTVSGSYRVKNTSDKAKGGGFFPAVGLRLSPFDQTHAHESSLVFPDVERSNDFRMETNRFGFYRVEAVFGQSKKSAWVFVATPMQLTGIAAFVLLVVLVVLWQRKRRSRISKKSHFRAR